MNHCKNLDTSFFIPIWLNFLNAPSLLYNIFPFIFLISTQFFLLNLIEKNEILVKNLYVSLDPANKIISFNLFYYGNFNNFNFL